MTDRRFLADEPGNPNFLRLGACLIWTLLCLLMANAAQAGATLEAVRHHHVLNCGVVNAANDETKDDTHGDLSGFGIEICRAVAAAVLGAAPPVVIHVYPAEALAYAALQAGDLALVVGGTPDPGLARRYDVTYLNPVFFDGEAILVGKDRGFASLRDLAGKHVCYMGGTDAETRMVHAARAAGIQYFPFPFEEIGEMEAALVAGRCDAIVNAASKLASGRAGFHGRIHDFDILPDRLSLDPLSPVVRSNDAEWARIVDWTAGALIQAEIAGVTRDNVMAMRSSPDPAVQILAGARRGPQWGLFLSDDWSLQAIRAVGNYGEIFERTAGARSVLRLERGLNRPWSQGGMLWGAPSR